MAGNPDAFAREARAVQFLRPVEKSGVASAANIGHDARSDAFRRGIAPAVRAKQILRNFPIESDDTHHSTILFKGYSTIPCALAAFSFGKICRTTASSMIVFTATHSGSLSGDIVGFFNAGSTSSTPGKSSRRRDCGPLSLWQQGAMG